MKQMDTQAPVKPSPGTVAVAPAQKTMAPSPAAPAPTGVAPAQSAPPKATPKPAKTVKVLQPFPALQAPPAVVSADKQQRLDDLLRKYRSDQLTPEEYHQQRAKILGEP
jgi:hypothetical protein